MNYKAHSDFIPAMYFYIGPFLSLIIGLRPILGLRTAVNTLYIDSKGRILINKNILVNISDIKSIEIKGIGSYMTTSYMKYYEISLNSNSMELNKILRNRSTILCADRYQLKNLLGTKNLLVQELLKVGLDEHTIEHE
jgi:hypothetical protein